LAAANPQMSKEGKGAWQGSRDPVKICSLNANIFVRVKAADFKFGMSAVLQWIIPTLPVLKISEKGSWPGSRDPVNFWGLNVVAAKWLKIRNSNLARVPHGQSRREGRNTAG